MRREGKSVFLRDTRSLCAENCENELEEVGVNDAGETAEGRNDNRHDDDADGHIDSHLGREAERFARDGLHRLDDPTEKEEERAA